MKIVTYTRVSTQKQNHSGLGLEAQEAAIRAFARERSAKVIAEYTEVESGKTSERPKLITALHHAKVTGAVLVIAKLDRLSRSASFTLTLRDSGVRFICCDMPEANDLTIGVLAVVAQAEAKAISERTINALKAAKARGTKLGNPNGAAALRRARKGNKASIAKIRLNADQRARDLASVIEDIQNDGHVTLEAIADELNDREIMTPRGGSWHPSSVSNLLRRIEH
jgi:DNA invertase Pin-like site-specific DNA recombinase